MAALDHLHAWVSGVFASMRLIHWALVVLVAAFLWMIQRLDAKKGNGYRLLDNLTDPVTNRASLDSLIIAFFAMLSAWCIVYSMLTNTPVPDALGVVLGIFVIKRIAARATDAKWGAPGTPTQGNP